MACTAKCIALALISIIVSLASPLAQAQMTRAQVVASNLQNPWAVAFLPDGRFLVTERPGRLRVSFMFDTINTSTVHIRAGRLRVLGVGSLKLSKIMPGVAPIAETIPGFEAVTWIGLLAPAGTPKDITLRMQREIEKIVQQPDIQERLSASGAEPIASTPEQFGAYLSSEVVKWARVVKQAKIPQIQQ